VSIPPPPPPPPPPTAAASGSSQVERPALEHSYRVYLGTRRDLLGTFLEVTGLAVEYETYEYAEGGNNGFVRRLRGRMKHPNLTLKSGVTSRTLLLQWVLEQGALQGPQNLWVVFTTPTGAPLRSFGFVHAVPVRWTGPTANIGANAVATETLEIAHHGLT
jgi:phage tail-like protein